MLGIEDEELEDLQRKIGEVVSAHFFSGIKVYDSAATYRRRAQLCGATMGRITAVLSMEKVDGDAAMLIRMAEERLQREMADGISSLVRPGGALPELWRREREKDQSR